MLLRRLTTWRGLNLPEVCTHIAFVFLAAMAYHLYVERLFADSAYYIFHVINKEWFYVEHSRLVLALSQFLPWIGVKLGLPMKAILILYSVGHVIFFYVIFLICRYRYYDKAAGLLLILIQTLGLELGYYTPMFELYYGTGMLVLFSSVLWKFDYGLTDKILLILTTVFILTSHPVAVLLWIFVLVLHGLDFGRQKLRWYGVFAGCLILLIGYKSVASSGYEQIKTTAFLDTFRVMTYGWAYLEQLAQFMVKYYSELLILCIGTMAWTISGKKYWRAVLVILGFIGMMVIINGAHFGFQHSRYQEQVYFPLTWIVAFPLVLMMNASPITSRWRRALVFIAFVLVFVKIVAILAESDKFSNRVGGMERQIDYARHKGVWKGIIGEVNVTRSTAAGPNWSYGIETLLLSARDGRDECVTLCLDSDMDFEGNKAKIKSDEFLMRKWNLLPLSWLNQQYFNVNTGNYDDLNSATIDDMILDSISSSSVEIGFPEADLHMPRGKVIAVQVRITNRFDNVLPSDTSHGLFLSYHWKLHDEIVEWDGLRTPLDVDIASEYQQRIDIRAPERTGHYTLVVDIVAEGRRWFGIDAGTTVWIY